MGPLSRRHPTALVAALVIGGVLVGAAPARATPHTDVDSGAAASERAPAEFGSVLVEAAPARATPAIGVEPGAAASDGAPADVGNYTEAVPRSKRVAVFTDSVGLGAKNQIPAAFPADWEVNVDGQPARFVKQMESQYVRPRLASSPHWFGDHVVMAAGYNAPLVSKSQMDPDEFDRQLDSMMATLTAAGVKHVHWVTLREVDPRYISGGAWRQIQPYYWYFPQVNDRLEAALARHPNLTLVDWAANANQPGLTYDAIHLNPTGARLFADLIKRSVDTSVTRVADKSTTKIHVPGAAGAAAATINVTTTQPRRPGHLTVHLCDEQPPTAAVHNFVRAQTVAHAAIAPLDANGDFCITSLTATNLVVDVTGLLQPGSGFSATRPTRWADTRSTSIVRGGTSLVLDIDDIPAGAGITGAPKALALSVTTVQARSSGHITVSSCDGDADHANVTYIDGAATPNLVFVQPDPDGRICLFTPTTTHLIVDVMGVFDDTAAIDVGNPERLFDSRSLPSMVAAGSTVRVDVGSYLSDDAAGAVLNITGLRAAAPGHFTAYPCADGLPEAANLNLVPGVVVANAAVITPDANGEICVRTHAAAHMVVDLLGEIGESFSGFRPVRVLDTRQG